MPVAFPSREIWKKSLDSAPARNRIGLDRSTSNQPVDNRSGHPETGILPITEMQNNITAA